MNWIIIFSLGVFLSFSIVCTFLSLLFLLLLCYTKQYIKSDLYPLQLFSHVSSPIVNLMVHKLKKKTLEKRENLMSSTLFLISFSFSNSLSPLSFFSLSLHNQIYQKCLKDSQLVEVQWKLDLGIVKGRGKILYNWFIIRSV
jgi:hypothetical protein